MLNLYIPFSFSRSHMHAFRFVCIQNCHVYTYDEHGHWRARDEICIWLSIFFTVWIHFHVNINHDFKNFSRNRRDKSNTIEIINLRVIELNYWVEGIISMYYLTNFPILFQFNLICSLKARSPRATIITIVWNRSSTIEIVALGKRAFKSNVLVLE